MSSVNPLPDPAAANSTLVELTVDTALLEHQTHLPETVECRCGYQRPDALAAAIVVDLDAVARKTRALMDEIRAEMALQRKAAEDLARLLGITADAAHRQLDGDMPVAAFRLTGQWLGVGMRELMARAESRLVAIDTVDATAAALDEIRDRVNDAFNEGRGLLERCRDDLLAAGVDAVLVTDLYSPPAVGDTCLVVESYENLKSGARLHRVDARRPVLPVAKYTVGPRVNDGRLFIAHGAYDVVLVDDTHPRPDVLLARKAEPLDAVAYRRTLGRLRTLARHSDLKVRVHDMTVTLVDHAGTEVFAGDAVACFAWILGIELDEAAA